jgi:hypothetical protein
MEALNSTFDIACYAAKAAMEATVVAHLGGPLTDKMPAGASNETDSLRRESAHAAHSDCESLCRYRRQ